MEKYKLEEIKANLALLYNQGADQFSKEAKETKTEKQHEEYKKFRKFIDQEVKKRNYDDPYKLTDYFAEHKKELFRLFEFSKKIKDKIEEGFIKVSIHSLEQKFAITTYNQLSIFDEIKDEKIIEKAKNLNIEIIGWNLSKAEDQAVFTIQKIYSKYNYRGNYNNGNALIFTPVEFYEAFGVLKYTNNLGKEVFSRAEEKHAFESLINLSSKQCIIAYNLLDTKTRKFNRVETLSAIIPEIDFLYTGLNKKELDNGKKKKKKLRYIKIIPSKVLLSQIKNYYALLPSNLYLEIKEKFPKVKNKHLPLFIQWLSKEIALKRRKNLGSKSEISFEKLSKILRMDNWIKAKQKKKIEDRLEKCFKQTKKMGYLSEYKISRGKTVIKKVVLFININKFKPLKQTEKIIYDSGREYNNKKYHIKNEPKIPYHQDFKDLKYNEKEKYTNSEEVKKSKDYIKKTLGMI